MALPLQPQAAQAGAELRGLAGGRRDGVAFAQACQVRAFGAARVGIDQHRQVAGARRRGQRLGWPRVHLLGERKALGVVTGQQD